MQIPDTSILRTRSLHHRQRLAAVSSAALLAVVAMGTWQIIAHHRGTSMPIVEHEADIALPAAAIRSDIGAGLATGFTVYVVASQEEAERMRGVLNEADIFLSTFGRPSPNSVVMVDGSPEGDALIRQALADTDGHRAGMGLPSLTVIDLRTPSR